MRHAELTPDLVAKLKAWQVSGYGKTMASLALGVSLPKINQGTPGYWGRRQLAKGLLRRLAGDYFVPPMMQGLHERFRRYVSKAPEIELGLLYRLLAVDARQFPVVGRWLALEQARVKARRRLANIAWKVWESYRDEGKERPGSPAQLVGSRWFEKHPEWITRNHPSITEAPVAPRPATAYEVTRQRVESDQVARNRELADLLWVTRYEWSNSR